MRSGTFVVESDSEREPQLRMKQERVVFASRFGNTDVDAGAW